mmetsp:Transcript_24551/g.21733  ORF Transcript_24551/g.21733 Transcript_24551/m.21733 type:complete len:102 (+) Transcript_24551:544-849(+)|eukprot:CAMPEP_0114592014 /NCGR_PEP_ID=MMETSP0125-20121206/13950_1 /TAXON_ID=485358 ORGANISM="Aristerostoma sp., Strain ATCC 50986" /NCGR_SAMPLE_ID=MMETSP0125 /ASSEMBLY_ACC=CAM_ASM_000245 /LENGTH=101 /DNA_ID=CAMNT_0001790453 /DNA_START=512 /DNA_END=817 /DNA_ORIENTATION=+
MVLAGLIVFTKLVAVTILVDSKKDPNYYTIRNELLASAVIFSFISILTFKIWLNNIFGKTIKSLFEESEYRVIKDEKGENVLEEALFGFDFHDNSSSYRIK